MALAAPPPAPTAPTDKQVASFNEYYQGAFPAERVFAPAFELTRDNGKTTLMATVKATPYRGHPMLCRQYQRSFLHTPGKPKEPQWRAEGEVLQFVWRDRLANCSSTTNRIRLLAPLPDTEIIALIDNNARLLVRSRLLWAGNSACSTLRNLRFHLSTLGVGTPVANGEQMYELGYLSDRESRANVYVRKEGQELRAWNAACPHP